MKAAPRPVAPVSPRYSTDMVPRWCGFARHAAMATWLLFLAGNVRHPAAVSKRHVIIKVQAADGTPIAGATVRHCLRHPAPRSRPYNRSPRMPTVSRQDGTMATRSCPSSSSSAPPTNRRPHCDATLLRD